MASYRYPSTASGSGVATYATFAAFPPSAADGTLALALDTDVLYAYNTGSMSWVVIGGPGSVLSLGNLDAQAAGVKGAALVANVLSMQSADATHAGLVNTTTQIFSGNKTFADIIDSGLTANTAIYSNGFKQLTSSSTSATELSYLTGVTSAVQTQLNSKQASGNYITALTGDVTASGPGSVVATLAATTNATLTTLSALSLPATQLSGTILAARMPAFTGDITTSAGAVATTLATVNSNVGSFTNASLTVNAKGLVTAASSGAAPEVPLTFSTGLTRTVNTVTVNTSQNIATLSNLTSNGFVKTGGGVGTISIDTSTYITGNQTITLSGDSTGSGTTAISTTLATVNSNVGSFTNASITVNAKGLVTAASSGSGGGAPIYTYTAKTATYTAAIGEYVNCTSGTFTVTLPTAASLSGQSIWVVNTGTGLITLATTSAQTIGGMASTVVRLGQNNQLMVTSDGSNWRLSVFEVDLSAKSFLGNSAASTTIANNTTVVMDFANSAVDPWGLLTTGSGFKFTAPMAGKYKVSVYAELDSVTWNGVNEQFVVEMSHYNSGASLQEEYNLGRTVTQVIGTYKSAVSGSTEVTLAATDYVQIRALQNSGSTATYSGTGGRGESWVVFRRVG